MGQNGILAILAVLLCYLAVGMVFDRKTRGSVHPAYIWNVGLLTASFVVVYPVSSMPAFRELASALAG